MTRRRRRGGQERAVVTVATAEGHHHEEGGHVKGQAHAMAQVGGGDEAYAAVMLCAITMTVMVMAEWILQWIV
jgi:hypothetical protein